MAVDMFLKIDGIEGESKDDSHPGEIDLLSWNWGMSQSGTTHMGGGGGAGKVAVQDISFTHNFDRASANLMLYCANGKHIPKAVLVVRKAGENPLEYLTITMENCIVTSVSTGGSGGQEALTENVTLNFSIVKVDYKEQDEKGGGGAAPEFAWDIQKNVPA